MCCEQVLRERSAAGDDLAVCVHADLAPLPRAAGRARTLIASVLTAGPGRERYDDLVDSVQLVASELVTNAVLHARTTLTLGICQNQQSLVVAVGDRATERHPAGSRSPQADVALGESGRGMTIVATLADDFGWRPRTDAEGKIIWALFELTETRGPVSPPHRMMPL